MQIVELKTLGGVLKVKWPPVEEAPNYMIGLFQAKGKRKGRCILLSRNDLRRLHEIIGNLLEKFERP